jgi:hypothetical protein
VRKSLADLGGAGAWLRSTAARERAPRVGRAEVAPAPYAASGFFPAGAGKITAARGGELSVDAEAFRHSMGIHGARLRPLKPMYVTPHTLEGGWRAVRPSGGSWLCSKTRTLGTACPCSSASRRLGTDWALAYRGSEVPRTNPSRRPGRFSPEEGRSLPSPRRPGRHSLTGTPRCKLRAPSGPRRRGEPDGRVSVQAGDHQRRAGVPWARIGEHVGQRSLRVTADTYSHVLADEHELDYRQMLH